MILDFLTGPFYFLLTLAVAVAAFWGVIWALNWSTKLTWDRIWHELAQGNIAIGIWAGLRLVAAAVLVVGAIGAGAY